MTWLVESPWPVLVTGILIEAVLAIALLRTGLAKVIAAMVGVLIVTVLLLLLERVVVTEFEEVEMALDSAATALAQNDVEKVVSFISPEQQSLKSYAERSMRQFKFTDAVVGGDLKVQVNRLTSPPSATAKFTVRLAGKDTRGTIPYGNLVERVELTLHKIGDRWYVVDYQPRH